MFEHKLNEQLYGFKVYTAWVFWELPWVSRIPLHPDNEN